MFAWAPSRYHARMSDSDGLLDALACPRCSQRIADRDGDLACKGCGTLFPRLAGVPFLFADPSASLMAWRQRLHMAQRKLAQDAQSADAAAADAGGPAKARLSRQAEAARLHADELAALLAPLELGQLEANLESYLALRTRLPSDQGLTTYYANLHRDWCWGDEENAISARLVGEALDGHAAERVLTLGAGAGRLAYDLHMAGASTLAVALDFNPLLALTAARVVAGETVVLHEFPIAPRRVADVAVAQSLRAPEPVRPGFEVVLGSALRAPFRPGAFDTLVTPWLCDILPETLPRQAARWNALLPTGGRWIWFGSHAFRSASPADNPCIEETLDIIEQAGFSAPTLREATIPYMDSPHSRHARREHVVVITTDKLRDVEPPSRHVALPDWLVTGDAPVPATEAFRMQSMSTRIHAFVMAMIDGKRSIRDMAALMESQRLMPRAEAEAAVRNFLIRMFEDAESYSGL